MHSNKGHTCSPQVCDLLDLLGGSEETLQPSSGAGGPTPGLPINTASTAGGDLLDLLGGLEPAPFASGVTTRYTNTHTLVFHLFNYLMLYPSAAVTSVTSASIFLSYLIVV